MSTPYTESKEVREAIEKYAPNYFRVLRHFSTTFVRQPWTARQGGTEYKCVRVYTGYSRRRGGSEGKVTFSTSAKRNGDFDFTAMEEYAAREERRQTVAKESQVKAQTIKSSNKELADNLEKLCKHYHYAIEPSTHTEGKVQSGLVIIHYLPSKCKRFIQSSGPNKPLTKRLDCGIIVS